MSPEATLLALAVLVFIVYFMTRGQDPEAPELYVLRALFFGDSATFGGYFEGGVLKRYNPDPVALVEQVAGGRLQCTNRAMNGLQLSELLAGGAVSMVAPGLGEPNYTDSLRQQLIGDTHDVIVLGCGNVDALFGHGDPKRYAAELTEAVLQVHNAGRAAAVRGLNQFLAVGGVDEAALARRDAFHAVARDVARNTGALFIDTDLAGEPTLCSDQLHPDEDYHRRIAAVVARALTA